MFVKNGRLNVVAIRSGKAVESVACDSPAFLQMDAVCRSATMDMITFHPNVVFKVTLDFKERVPCVASSGGREATDWTLVSCMGQTASYNRIEERLTLQYCTVSIESKVEAFMHPVNLVLKFDEDHWAVEKIYR